MESDKIEPRLAEEIARVRAAGEPDRPIPVLIEHTGPAELPQGGDFAHLERLVAAEQRDLVAHLRDLGVEGAIEQLVLANAIAAELTPPQIGAAAALDAVRAIRLSRLEQVTT